METKTGQKMKNQIYKTGSLLLLPLLLITITLSGQNAVTKEFHKEYSAGANTTLDLSNRYGEVVIESWDKDQIIIDVKVKVEMPNREKAEKYLSYIDVIFSEGDNTVSAKTTIDDKFNFSGWGMGSRKFSIDYTVKMPRSSSLTLANKYGNSSITDLSGLVNLDIKYGDLKAAKFSRGNVKPLNRLSLAYGKGSVEEAGWFDLNLRYVGSMEIDKCQALLLNSKYSKLIIGEASSIVGETKYDNLRIRSVNNLVLDNGYTETNVGTLTKKLEYNGSYGSFSIDRVPAGFESIKTETHYMGVKIGIDDNANYNLEAKVSYGDLKYNEDNFNNQRRIVENNSNEVAGVVGKESSPAARVKVVASYGSVRLYQ